MMATNDDYQRKFNACIKRERYPQSRLEMLASALEDVDLAWVQTCMAIGPGAGSNEVEFMKSQMPNLTKFIAVEPDAGGATKLRDCAKNRLPNVQTTVHEMEIQKYRFSDERLDAVLMFDFFYYMHDCDERKQLFWKLYERLSPQGILVVHHETYLEKYAQFHSKLDCSIVLYDQIVKDAASVGFKVKKEYQCDGALNIETPEYDFLEFLRMDFDKFVPLEKIRKVMEQMAESEIPIAQKVGLWVKTE